MRKIYRVLSIILCLCLLMGHIPSMQVRAQSDVIKISSLDEFLAFTENCRLDSYSAGKTFRLTVDIDLTEVAFDGIPVFCGTFEGADHRISGLQITSAGSAKGLFRYISATASVRDLKVSGVIVPTGSRSQVGGIAGENSGLIENCSFEGTVIGGDYVGGIAGINQSGAAMRNCKASGIVSGKHFAGGIAGRNNGSIYQCENLANINTTAQQNQIEISDIKLENLLDTESAAATTDIGGIAGVNDGMIIGCSNRGSVGYKHMGYNIGGIAGVQTGYIADCRNFADIFGRKEIGGIAGQQEPEVVLNYATDTLQILQAQVATLSDLVDYAVANGNDNATHIKNLLYKLERYVIKAQDAADFLNKAKEEPKLEDLQSYADALKAIRESIQGISNTIRVLWESMDETMGDLDKDMQAISEQLAVIEATLNHADDNIGGQIFDISDQDTADQLTSKVENCQNFGAILGDRNTGGIIGAVSFENDLDPEEDITVIGDTTLNAIGSLRSVVLSCSNAGRVEAKYQRAGGIIGWLTMGAVKECINTAYIGADSADFAGGIAGEAHGYIRNCHVKAHIVGSSHVGGIAGSSTTVTDCYAMAWITGTEKTGGILGQADTPHHQIENPISGNYYLIYDTDPGGIDGISYENQANGLQLAQFLEKQNNLDIFNYVTIYFVAEGNLIEQVTLPTGASLEAVPQVPAKTGYTGAWEGLAQADLSRIIFDITFHAQYTQYTSTIQTENMGDDGKPLLLLQGDFTVGATVTASKLEHFSALKKEHTLLQCWEFHVENCINLHTGRFLLPRNVDTERLLLFVRDQNGNWVEKPFAQDESYIVFTLSNGDSAIALVYGSANILLSAELWIAAGCGALVVLITVLIFTGLRKRKVK